MDTAGLEKITLSSGMHFRFKEMLLKCINFNTKGQTKSDLEATIKGVSQEKIQIILQFMNERDRNIFIAYLNGQNQREITNGLSEVLTAKKVGEILANWTRAIYAYIIDNNMSAMRDLNSNWADYRAAKADLASRFKITETFFKSLLAAKLISEELATLLIDYYSQVLRLGTNTKGHIRKEAPPPILTDPQYQELYIALVDNLTAETVEIYQPFILAVKEKADSLGARNQTNIKNVIHGAYAKLIFLRPELQRVGTRIISDKEA